MDSTALVDQLDVDEISLFEEEETVEVVERNLQFPCMVLEGVLINQEVVYLQERGVDQESAIPLYIRQEGEDILIGQFDMSLDSLLCMRRLGYDMTLYLPNGEERKLDNPDLFFNFIRL